MADFSTPSLISVTCPKMITPLLKMEVEQLGYTVLNDRVAGLELTGTLSDCMRLNLSLRTAHRIHYLVKKGKGRSIPELTQVLKSIAWESFIPKHGYVSVTSAIQNKAVKNSQFANRVIKDAIVDRIRSKTGARPDSGPKLNQSVVFVYWKNEELRIFLDTSGESVSRRGYRIQNHTAPMQESLAAALVLSTQWDRMSPFLNPMCGSGTLAIEAAMIALNKAPGLLRPNFGIKHIIGFDQNNWNVLRDELKHRAKKDFEVPIIASDHDSTALQALRKNLETAGLQRHIEFEKRDVSLATVPDASSGVVIMNPPYGERLGEEDQLSALYRKMGDFLKQKCSGYKGYIFTGNKELGKSVGLRTSRKLTFYNSTIECRLLEYDLY
ncbi:MAG: methyltransferase [Bacteroidota bacterium]